ncbi:MAG TPA: universal stress protein [Acidobacteriaceae bacterium]
MIAESNSSVCDVVLQEPYNLKKMIVADDGSAASKRALADAWVLAKRYQAELVIVHVQSPLELDNVEDGAGSRYQRLDIATDVDGMTKALRAEGVQSRGIVRAGAPGDTLFNLCCEENADLLLMGAYGHNSQDRQTLGSTAEQLLRGVPCPVLTYGPNVSYPVISGRHSGPILLPVSLPLEPRCLEEAIAFAQLFGEPLEVFHAVDRILCHNLKWFERHCEELAFFIRANGVPARWSFLYGEAGCTICSEAREEGSPFILMPLKWRKGLSSLTSDNVAAHVIRRSSVPVLSYRCD